MNVIESNWISTVRSTISEANTDYFRIKPAQYWFDFLLSMTLAYTAASIFLGAPLFSLWQLAAFPIAVFWLYRLGSLVHEVCHLPHKEMRAFKVAWNLAAGVMTLAPSPFFTRHHRDHHSQRMYGTPQDPEYITNTLQPGNWLSLAWFGVRLALFPLVVWLRFVLAPLTFLHPKLREWFLTHASSLTLNWRYERRMNTFDRWAVTTIELLCWLRASLIPFAVLMHWTPWTRMPLMYLLAVGVIVLNHLRLMADHHFESSGELIDLPEHVQDSCNFTSHDPLTWLLFPFSIRYHALHHLFPTMPYHNLAAAHGYLTKSLPADSPYRQLDQSSWWPVARKIFGWSGKRPAAA